MLHQQLRRGPRKWKVQTAKTEEDAFWRSLPSIRLRKSLGRLLAILISIDAGRIAFSLPDYWGTLSYNRNHGVKMFRQWRLSLAGCGTGILLPKNVGISALRGEGDAAAADRATLWSLDSNESAPNACRSTGCRIGRRWAQALQNLRVKIDRRGTKGRIFQRLGAFRGPELKRRMAQTLSSKAWHVSPRMPATPRRIARR